MRANLAIRSFGAFSLGTRTLAPAFLHDGGIQFRIGYDDSPISATIDGNPVSYEVGFLNGTEPILYEVDSGALPGGLTLDGGTGEISGTLTTAGTFSAVIKATDDTGLIAYTTFEAVVEEGSAPAESLPLFTSAGYWANEGAF